MTRDSDIVKVAQKVRAFRADHPITEIALVTDFVEDEAGGVARVVGHCRAIQVGTNIVLAEAYGTRALRPPKPGAQGHQDTRDPDRAMTQATGRCLGLLGYADGESLEGDTDEPDSSGVTQAASRQDEVPFDQPATKDQLAEIEQLWKALPEDRQKAGQQWIETTFDVAEWERLSRHQAQQVIRAMSAEKAKAAKAAAS